MDQGRSLSSFELGLAGRVAELVGRFCRPDDALRSHRKKPRVAANDDNESVLDKIKSLCKTVPEASEQFAKVISKDYLGAAAPSVSHQKQVKLALSLANELFLRSSKFRAEMCLHMARVLDCALRIEGGGEMMLTWEAKFGECYPQLALATKADVRLVRLKGEMERTLEMQRAVDAHQLDEISRGFRMFHGQAVLTGLGESVSHTLEQCMGQIKQLDGYVHLFLTYSEDSSDDGELEWETEEVHSALPLDYSIAVSVPTSLDRDKLVDVQSAMRDGVLSIQRTLLPTVRLWADVLERADLAHSPTLELLKEIKTLLRELNEVCAQCHRCLGDL
ncbi:hypothetical protein BASA81_012809 [Batrachochytrium salamandrivorans]|nr:hypothetical protein BASA81_012809 [Batrachochytrium salamandrivorans]